MRHGMGRPCVFGRWLAAAALLLALALGCQSEPPKADPDQVKKEQELLKELQNKEKGTTKK